MIGLLLHIEEYKANSQRGVWLSADGLQVTFQRLSSKEPTPTPPLFGTSELAFKSKNASGEAQFIHEWLCLRPRDALSKPYRRFETAGYLAVFLRENAGILPEPLPVFELASQAYDALEKADEPLVITFKILYKIALMEGFPVKEDWLARQNPGLIQIAGTLLKQPSNAPTILATPRSTLISLVQKLQIWLSHHTEFRLPQTQLSGI